MPSRVRYQAIGATQINFAQEANRLAEQIKLYQIDA